MDLDPTQEALDLHQSFQGAFNVKAYVARGREHMDGGALFGAAPWHLGQLASALCIFDIFCGWFDGSE
eukprot:3390825-Karenia_brevis.AAC.1